jgi:fibronectin type 3 domain-containing protein
MKQNFMKILVIQLALALPLLLPAQTFVHPGGLHTQADLDRMKSKVAAGEHPWIDDWNKLITDAWAQNTYSNGARANMGTSRQRADQDAHAAYLNAIRWYISGDTTFAACAVRNLNAWSAVVNQVPTGTDIPGLSGIPIFDFALAAEVLRIYPGWAPADFNRFKNMMRTYFYPVVHDFLTNHNGTCISNYWANWDIANIGSLIAMGVLLDDTTIYNEGVNYFYNGAGMGSINNAVYFMHPNGLGQWQESGRDQPHAMLGVGMMASFCQVAWNQGLDLFGYENNRLLAGAEYVARTNLSQPVPYEPYNNCQPANQYWLSLDAGRIDGRPIWELIYNHYGVLKGLPVPNVKAITEVTRPEVGSIDHFGYGTLTFTLDASQSPYPALPVPAVPSGVTAIAGVGRVDITWALPAVPNVNGYRVQRATTPGGPYTTIASWNTATSPSYVDGSVTNGTTYYYVIAANNQTGTSGNSVEVSATPMAASAVLPAGWSRQDIGAVSVSGSATYGSAGGNTFFSSGAGAMGGISDACGFTYAIGSGDVSITARMIGMGGTNGKAGIMIRESLATGAKTFVMKRGDLGWRQTGFGARTTNDDAVAWTDGHEYITSLPFWIRLQRVGNTITGSESRDGINWVVVATATATMGSNCYIGFFNASGNAGLLSNATYDNVTIINGNATAPNAPQGLTAAAGNTQDTLQWNAVDFASGYTLKRATVSGGPYTTVASNLNVTNYTDTGLTNGTTYYYVVTAANLGGESVNSAEVAVTPQLAIAPVPVGVTAKSVSLKQINLSWTASLSAATYNVKRAAVSGGTYTTIGSTSGTAYSDSTITDTVTYYYVVSAVNAKGESANSTEVKAAAGKVAYYKFDESAGTTAVDAWSSLNGTLASGASFLTGIHNNGVRLDGSSNGFVTLPTGLMTGINDFTAAAWVRLDSKGNWARVFDFGTGTTNYMFLTIQAGTNNLIQYSIKNATGSFDVKYTYPLALNTWTHFAITQSGNTCRMYINGALVQTNTNATIKPAQLDVTSQNYVGKSQFSADAYLNGTVDEFQLYSKALSASEIAALVYESVPPGSPTNVSVTGGDNQVALTWDAAISATGYNVKRATSAAGPFTTIASVSTTSYTDNTAENCTTYYYVVSAVNSVGEGANSILASLSYGKKQTGTLIGTNGSWGNNPATTKAAAVDGNLGTFFDGPSGISWVGYDLGADSASVITKVRYAPRSGYEARMVNGQFQGSNVADFSTATTLFTVTTQPATGVYTEQTISNTTPFRYVRYISSSTGSGNVSEVEFYGLKARAPQIVSKAGAKTISYDSSFSYAIKTVNSPNSYSAAGLPDGLSLNTCSGIISGAPKAVGTFTVLLTAANQWGAANDTMTLKVYRVPTVKAKNIQVTLDSTGHVAITAQQVNDGSVSYAGALTLSIDRTDFTCSDIGNPVPVVLTGTDAEGRSAFDTAQVTVTDVLQPVVTAPGDPFFCYNNAGSYTVPAISASDNCGVATVGYSISGATSRTGSGTNASGVFAAGISTITWTVTDVHGNVNTATTTVTVNAPLTAVIPDVYAMNSKTDDRNTIYIGYGPASLTVTATASGGTAPYSYLWSGGQTTASISVSTAGNYNLAVTDAKACTTTASIVMDTVNVQCGKSANKVTVCHNNNTICIDSSDVQEHLAHGDKLNGCKSSSVRSAALNAIIESGDASKIIVYPNPVTDKVNIRLQLGDNAALLKVYNSTGVIVITRNLTNNTSTISLSGLPAGMYFIRVANGKDLITKKIVKQ